MPIGLLSGAKYCVASSYDSRLSGELCRQQIQVDYANYVYFRMQIGRVWPFSWSHFFWWGKAESPLLHLYPLNSEVLPVL